jgi:hypothetical protein
VAVVLWKIPMQAVMALTPAVTPMQAMAITRVEKCMVTIWLMNMRRRQEQELMPQQQHWFVNSPQELLVVQY